MTDDERSADEAFEARLRDRLDDAAGDAPRVDVDALLGATAATAAASVASVDVNELDVRRERSARSRRLQALVAAAAVVTVVGVGGVGLFTGGDPAQTPGASSPTSGTTDSPEPTPTVPSGPATGVLPPALCAETLRFGGRTWVATDLTPSPGPSPTGGARTGLVERCSTDPADPEPERSRVEVVPVDDTTVIADGTTWVLYGG